MEKKTPNIYSALAKAQAEFEEIKMTAKVKFGQTEFKYAPLSEVINKTRPALVENGITLTFKTEGDKITAHLYHAESDSELTSFFPLESSGKMQEIGSRMTYIKRYLLVNMLAVGTEEDGDHGDLSNDAKKAAEVAVMERAKAAIRESKPNVLEGMLSKFNLTSDQVRDLVKTEMSVQAEKEDSND